MAVVFHIVVALIALACAALIAAPLRKASPRLYGAILVTIPLLAFTLYQLVGTPAALDRAALAAPAAEGPQSIDEAIAQLEAVLQREPAQPEGWALLARSYATRGEPVKARDAFATALRYLPDDPMLLVEGAQARAQADVERRFDDEALDMLRKALAIDPPNQRALWFIGVAQRQRGEDAEAAATWEALLPKVDADTVTALRTQIDEAREAAGLPPLPAAETPTATDGAAGPGLRVRVSLDPDFAARVRLRGDTTVFVIARPPGGPPMPVAVERHALQDLPLDIVLDDGDSPMPTQALSSLSEVEVFARLSASGTATREQGDIESRPVRVALPATAPVDLVIGEAIP